MSTNLDLSLIRKPLLERFELRGLYGYKTLAVNCETNVKIVSAENGSGKTTLLNALYAMLTGKVGPLLGINFHAIHLKLANFEEIVVTRDELSPPTGEDFVNRLRESSIGREFLTYGATPDEIREALIQYISGNAEFESTRAFHKVYINSPHARPEVRNRFSRLLPTVSGVGVMSAVQERIKTALNGATVLYLPTYRRIEADLPEFSRRTTQDSPMNELRHRRAKNEWATDQLIFFGMKDVEQRLKDVTDDIRSGTFEAYARISARTLDEMIGTRPVPALDIESIDIETLRLVLARLGKSESESEKRIADLIASKQINDNQFSSLRSFLTQLADVYSEKRDSEKSIEKFISVINRYWIRSTDKKELRFDKFKVEVGARSLESERILPLSALSSGEKQILSVFARLFLDWGKKYLILIDEPELSLSLDWQRSFLPDVLSTPSCEQILAITHSPFVFENELDRYAGSIESSVVRGHDG